MITPNSPSSGRRWFADENLIAVAKALEAVGLNIVHPGHPACPDIPTSTSDEDWIPIVTGYGWPILTQDEKILHKPDQRNLLHRHGATVFFLTTTANDSAWDTLRLIARHWDRISSLTSKLDNKTPRLHTITKRGVGPI